MLEDDLHFAAQLRSAASTKATRVPYAAHSHYVKATKHTPFHSFVLQLLSIVITATKMTANPKRGT
jgi:hypothetical protein